MRRVRLLRQLSLLALANCAADRRRRHTHSYTHATHARCTRSRCTPASSPTSFVGRQGQTSARSLSSGRPVVLLHCTAVGRASALLVVAPAQRHARTLAHQPRKKNKIWRKFSLDFFHSSVARLRASPRRTSMLPPLRTRLLLLLLVERDERDVGDFDDLEADAGWRRDTTSWRKLPVTKSTARKRASEHARAQAASGVHPRARVSRAAGDACSLPPLSVRSCHDTCAR